MKVIKLNSVLYRQVLVAVIANFSSIGFGLITGWSSPNVAKLQDDGLKDTPLDRTITAGEVGWIGSLVPIGGAISPIFAGTIARKFGRKTGLLLTGVCLLVAYIILGFGTSIEIIYVARLLHGISAGVYMTVMPIYIGEISQDAIRGALGTMFMLFLNVGLLFSYCVGPFVPYALFQFLSTIFPIAFLVLFAFMPETPVYYLMNGNREKASKSLTFLRATPDGIDDELDMLQGSIDQSQHQKGSWLHLFTRRGNLRALTICCGLVAIQQFSGINAVIYFAQTIFKRAGGEIEPEIAAIILVGVPTLVCWTTPILMVRFDRKTNLMVSVVGMGIAAALLTAYFALDEHNPTVADSITFIPIVSLIIYLVLYNVGIGLIPYAMVGEIFAPDIRTYATIVVSTVSWTCAAIVVLFFEPLNEAVGPEWVFAIFTICLASGVLFIYFYVIETRGLTLIEIQDRLHNTKK